MTKHIYKNKTIIPFILAAILLAVSVFAIAFNFKTDVFASGGNFVQTPHLEVKLDINGKDGDKASPELTYTSANDAFKNRFLSVQCFIDAYADKMTDNKNDYNINNYKLYATTLSSTAYVNTDTDAIYNPVKTYVDVSYKTGNTAIIGSMYEVQSLGFGAQKVKSDAFITLTFKKEAGKVLPTPDEIQVFVRVNIISSIPMVSREAKPVTFVGTKTADAVTPGQEIPSIIMRNNTSITFDLSEQLKGRKLYNLAADNRTYNLIAKDSAEPWVINDVQYLRFNASNVKFSNGYIKDENISIMAAPDSDKPLPFMQSIFINIKITEDTVAKYDSDNAHIADAPSFWDTTHSFTLELRSAFNSDIFTFKFNIKFVPDDKLNSKKDFTMPTALNAASSYEFTTSHTTEGKQNGYKTVCVYPNYITDYPFTVKQIFKSSEKPEVIAGANVVQVTEFKDDKNAVYYQVTGVETGPAKIKFKVWSGLAQDTENNVIVNFSVYGQYVIKFDAIEGKRTRVYEPTDATFKQLFDDGYYLQDVKCEESNIAIVQRQGNNLSIAPKSSGAANIKLTFQNSQNRIEIVSTVLIDIEGGSIFSKFEDWQIGLIIAGVSIGVLAILLLIIWLFIRGVRKSKRDELETSAPTSAYIIKLNSTIAAAQAQQRLVTTQAFSNAQTQMLQLGAGPTTTPAPGAFNTLQLGSAPVPPPQATNYSGGAMSMPPVGDIIMPPSPPPAAEEIYIPLTDDELLERIFVEKYEPRGMARRSFFKSKDLQAKELEKEKNRIREDVRNGMSIEEACRPKKAADAVITAPPAAPEKEPATIVNILGFDPDAAVEVTDEAIESDPDMLDEQRKLLESENKLKKIQEVNGKLKERLAKAESELAVANKAIEDDKILIQQSEEKIAKLQEELTDLEIKLASAKSKDKEKLAKDVEIREKEIESTKSKITSINNGLEDKHKTVDDIEAAIKTINSQKSNTNSLIEETNAEITLRASQAQLATERVEKAKAQQELNRRMDYLNPLFLSVNTADLTLRSIENAMEKDSAERNSLKAEVSRIQAQLLSATESALIGSLNESITAKNKRIGELDKTITANTKLKADKSIEITGIKRKANEYIDRENIDIEHIIYGEDRVIGDLALSELAKQSEADKEKAEKDMLAAQALYDDLSNNSDSKLMEAVSAVAASIKELENEVASVQGELGELNEKMDAASDDDKLMLSIDQMSLQEKLNELTAKLEDARANGIKTNLETKLKCEEEVENARLKLEGAKEEFEKASLRYNDSINSINPLDLIISGSGVVSQERSKIEAANLKKQLEQSKNAIEQAKLQAQMAQMEAEKAIIDAKRASDASKEEAERLAKEAIAKAEQAKHEAEAKAVEESEKIKREAAEETEKAKRLAAEETERAKRLAAEETERAKQEAEDAKKAAEEQIEKVKQEAEDAKKSAEEKIEKVKLEAEEAEKARLEAEEAAKKSIEEQIAAKNAKIAKRKNEILELRKEISNIFGEEDAYKLKERFYAISKSFDQDEMDDIELQELIRKSIDDTMHAQEINLYKKAAQKDPRKIVKKVTERVNRVPQRPGASAGARPAPRPGAPRPAGARPAGSGAPRPAGARPAAPRPGAPRPTGARPAGSAGPRPVGARPPAPRPGAPRPTGARPTAGGPRPAPRPGTRPPNKP